MIDGETFTVVYTPTYCVIVLALLMTGHVIGQPERRTNWIAKFIIAVRLKKIGKLTWLSLENLDG